ncbi:hypothetical protein CNR22_22780 [Sphingobacteriaceae bacterium]|nr:hypothetical protein CNR22_22780 [Sphingobacteriaceae bacterium]
MTSEAYITKHYYSEKPANGEVLSLSILIGPASFVYAISTQNFKNVIELCHVEITHLANTTFDLTDKISFLVNNYLLHQKKFERVNVSFLNTDFTMLPEAFSQVEDIKPILHFATGVELVKRSLKHSVKNINFCFTVESDLLNYFEKTFPNASLRHQGAVSMSLFFSQHSLKNANLYLNIGDGFIELAAKDKTEVLFYNVFAFENNEDILYYVLFMMEQFNLNPLHVRLSVAAERNANDSVIQSLKKYIRQVEFCVSDASVKLNGELASMPQHYYFTLLNQHLCEL